MKSRRSYKPGNIAFRQGKLYIFYSVGVYCLLFCFFYAVDNVPSLLPQEMLSLSGMLSPKVISSIWLIPKRVIKKKPAGMAA